MQIDFCKQDDKKKSKNETQNFPHPLCITRPNQKEEREKENPRTKQKLSHSFPLKWLSAKTSKPNQKSKNLSKQEEKKEIS